MELIANLDLFSVGIAIAAIGVLGAVVYFSDRKSLTNQAFFALSVMTICWSVFNYLVYQPFSNYLILWFLRVAVFSAVWHSFFLFQLFYVFPATSIKMSSLYKFAMLPATIIVSILTLTPFVFKEIVSLSQDGRVTQVTNGSAIIFFSLVILFNIGGGIYQILRKTIKATGVSRLQFKHVLLGTFFTFTLIIIFNLVLPAFLDDARFIQFGAVFMFPFIFFSAYAIIRHHLLNIKVIATEVLTFILAVVTFFEVIFSENLTALILRISIFLLVLSFGILLIRSVRQEVRQRERLEKLSRELQRANIRLKELDQQKTDFLSIAAHQLRTPLTILNGYIELIQEGGYGKVNNEVKSILTNMDENNSHLIKLVNDFLNITRIEQGRTKYEIENLDLQALIQEVVTEFSERAKEKGLKIKWKKKLDLPKVMADREKIHHVILNFIDNGIKYTEKGNISIAINEENGGVTVRVKDSGLGFDKVDEANFFQKFYRGHNVKRSNVNGTGLGLYVCRKFIEGHRGRIWAKSQGEGKGSEFGFWVSFNQKLQA